MDVRLFSAPLTLNDKLKVVSVQEAMAHVRITAYDEALVIANMIGQAYDYLSDPMHGWLNGCILLEQTFDVYLTERPGRDFEVPLRPLKANVLTSFEYLDSSDDWQAITTGDYSVMTQAAGVALVRRVDYSWPYTGLWRPWAMRFRCVAGYGTTKESIPSPLRLAILMLVGHWYGQRETTGTEGRSVSQEVKYGLMSLAGRYRFSPDHS